MKPYHRPVEPDSRYKPLRRVLGWLLAFLLGCSLAMAQSGPAPEASVKAVFIFNFTQFVTWPAEAFAGADSPFIIGILGPDPFGRYMQETVRGEKVGTHPIRIQRFSDVTEARVCHLLYISLKEEEKVRQALASLNPRPVLTVGEDPQFARQGGMIRFLTQNQKIRLEINPAAVRASQLSISSKLLSIAMIVE